MPEPEPTPEFQATADLSPLSPSPLHSAAPAVVPVLQDTADILDAMSTQTNGVAHGGIDAPAPSEPYPVASTDDANGDGDADDADSLDDAYGEDAEETGADKVREQQVAPDAGEEDFEYYQSFESPPAGVEEDSAEQEDVSKARESMHNSAASDSLTSLSQVAAPPVADPSSARSAAGDHPSTESAPSATAAAQQGAESSASNATAALSNGRVEHVPEDDHAADISRLLTEMTGQASAADNSQSQPASSQNHDAQSSSNLTSAAATLPPRPPLPQQTAPAYASEDYRGFQQNTAHVSSNNVAPPTPGQPSTYVAAGAPGAPGTAPDAFGSLPPPPATGLNAPVPITSMTAPPYPNPAGPQANQPNDTTDYQRLWDTFVADERRYMADGKWDKFPEGSRIFIGNLSSERVAKTDVFNIFHKYGRLAQISLKSAYGFVQYHNLEDAQAAMDNLQGIEIKGRKIHLEVSKAQKKKDGNERNRSQDRGRGGRQSGRQDKHEGANQNHDNRRGRDDYRPGSRNTPPRRNNGYGNGRDENHGRDRYHYDSHDRSRGRSRSPQGHGRQHDNYRRRSPSPRRGPPSEDLLDIPRRYGSQVPDVQLLLHQEVARDFIAWVERAFVERGLRVDVMFLHPRFPREAVVQRQAVEGVHAIVDLDMNAYNTGKIPLRVFDRSAGLNTRYDDYANLDPTIAAELILRAKSQAMPYQSAPPPQQHYQGYGQPYGVSQPPTAPTPTYGGQGPRGPPPQMPPALPADLSRVMQGLDNTQLQQLLASMGSQGIGQAAAANDAAGAANAHIQAMMMGDMARAPPAAPAQPAMYDMQTFPPNGPPPNGHHPAGHSPAGPSTGDSNAQVQNIMAQLARYRQ